MGRLSESIAFANLDEDGMKRYVTTGRDFYFKYITLENVSTNNQYWKLRKAYQKDKKK